MRGELNVSVSDTGQAPDTCTIEVRYKPVIGPTNHAFIVTSDADSVNYFRGGPRSNETGLNSSSAGSSDEVERLGHDARFGIYGPIVTEFGAYLNGTVDWTTVPSRQQTVSRTRGNCDGIESRLSRHMNDIEAAQINYIPPSVNSNSTVREALERAGFDNVSPVVWSPGWNTQLPGPR